MARALRAFRRGISGRAAGSKCIYSDVFIWVAIHNQSSSSQGVVIRFFSITLYRGWLDTNRPMAIRRGAACNVIEAPPNSLWSYLWTMEFMDYGIYGLWNVFTVIKCPIWLALLAYEVLALLLPKT